MDDKFDLDKVFRSGATGAFGQDVAVGQTVTGTIESAEAVQAQEFGRDGKPTGKLRFWDDGKPVMQIRIIVSGVKPVDEDDDGRRSITVKAWGQQQRALTEAVQAAGFEKLTLALAPGNVFTATLTALVPGSMGTPAREYAYVVQRATSADLDAAVSTPAAQAPATPPVDTAPAGDTNAKFESAKQLIALGSTDEEIAKELDMLPLIVAKLRSQVTDVAPF